jgi:hypothetical protein
LIGLQDGVANGIAAIHGTAVRLHAGRTQIRVQRAAARFQTGTAGSATARNVRLPAFTLTRAGLHGTAVAVHRLESLATGLLDDFWVAARSTRCRPRTRHGRRHFCIAASFKRFVTTLDALIE